MDKDHNVLADLERSMAEWNEYHRIQHLVDEMDREAAPADIWSGIWRGAVIALLSAVPIILLVAYTLDTTR